MRQELDVVGGRARVVMLCVLALTAAGCQSISPQNRIDARFRSTNEMSANSEQIRLRMRSLVQPMTAAVAEAADQIAASSADPSVRRHALLWKIQAVPALREALFQPNPLTAGFDTWVMTNQMADYFESGPGRRQLGPAHVIALETCRQLEAEMARVAASMTKSGDMSDVRKFAKTWAAEHPILGEISGRQSTLSRVTEREVADSFSAMQAIGSVTLSVDDLNRRIEIYSAQLLDQTRWQAELFTGDLADRFQAEKALPLAERSVQALERSVALLETAPGLIATERAAAFESISTELSRTITFVQSERVAALHQLTQERIAAVQDLRDTVVDERKELTKDLAAISLQAVDRAFLRLAQIVALSLLALFLAAVALLFLTRRLFPPQPPASSRGGASPGAGPKSES